MSVEGLGVSSASALCNSAARAHSDAISASGDARRLMRACWRCAAPKMSNTGAMTQAAAIPHWLPPLVLHSSLTHLSCQLMIAFCLSCCVCTACVVCGGGQVRESGPRQQRPGLPSAKCDSPRGAPDTRPHRGLLPHRARSLSFSLFLSLPFSLSLPPSYLLPCIPSLPPYLPPSLRPSVPPSLPSSLPPLEASASAPRKLKQSEAAAAAAAPST